MTALVYILPFFVALILLIFFRKQTVWWEYLILIVPSVLLALLVEFGLKKYNTTDTEYLGYYVTKISHYDRWNEYIHKTCTRQVACGKDSKGNTIYRSETYDCSYVEDHPERWTYTLNNGNEEYFYSKNEFEIVKKQLNAPMEFVDMHRNYHTIDGDKQDYKWDYKYEHAYLMTFPHKYDNYVQSSHSIFKMEDISKKRAKKMKLYDYPEIINYDQSGIIGYNADVISDFAVRYINGMYGGKYQFRLFILVYPDRPVSVVEKQKAYWKNGNKNELVVCIGYNTQKKDIMWCECFSWSDAPKLEVETKQYFLDKDSLDFTGYCTFLKSRVPYDWKRKEFKDFKYIEIDLSDGQVSFLFTLVLLYNILISIYIVRNQFKEEENVRRRW